MRPSSSASSPSTVVQGLTAFDLFIHGTAIATPIALSLLGGAWLLSQRPVVVETKVVVTHEQLLAQTPAPQPTPTPATSSPSCRGLTWHVVGQDQEIVHVRTRDNSGAYKGDTSCATSLPVLCIKKEGLALPSYSDSSKLSEINGGPFYDGWTGGRVALSAPTLGAALTSLEAADGICRQAHGAGWRMAEFHDGGGGWGFHAFGKIPSDATFWVSINDQPANPWNSR